MSELAPRFVDLPVWRQSMLVLSNAGSSLWRMPDDGSCWVAGYGPGNEPLDVTGLALLLAAQGLLVDGEPTGVRFGRWRGGRYLKLTAAGRRTLAEHYAREDNALE